MVKMIARDIFVIALISFQKVNNQYPFDDNYYIDQPQNNIKAQSKSQQQCYLYLKV